MPSGNYKKTSASPAPVVLWTHGTSGFYINGAPSTQRIFFYEDFVPFTLAEAGYAVVALDYAGLGVSTSWDRTFIPYQYFASEAGAADALNALRAVQKSFPGSLSPDFVVMGHSQGGSVAWRLSEVLARNNQAFSDVAKGHLGTVAIAPNTDIYLHFQLGSDRFGRGLERISTRHSLLSTSASGSLPSGFGERSC